MTKTLATRQQAAAIRQRMSELRTNLPREMDVARERVRELTSWRYHMRTRPWPILGVALGLGYLIVPAKPPPRSLASGLQGFSKSNEEVARKSVLGGAAAALLALVARSGTTMAMRYLTDAIYRRTTDRQNPLQRPLNPDSRAISRAEAAAR